MVGDVEAVGVEVGFMESPGTSFHGWSPVDPEDGLLGSLGPAVGVFEDLEDIDVALAGETGVAEDGPGLEGSPPISFQDG